MNTAEEAALAYDHAAYRFRGQHAKLNFPELVNLVAQAPEQPQQFPQGLPSPGNDADFRINAFLWRFSNDSRLHSSQQEEIEDAQQQEETDSLDWYPSVEIDWDAIIEKECVAGENKGGEKDDSTIHIVNKTRTEEMSKEEEPEKGFIFDILNGHFGKPLDDAAKSFHEKDDSTIHVVNKTCIEETSKGKNPEKGISFEILSKQFGKPLDDAAKSFQVSRSTFKRICRVHGIRRWKSGKRRVGNQSSSEDRRVNDKEPSTMNFSCLAMPQMQVTTVVAPTNQDMNKINVKASYNGVAIRFELLDSSGMAELEDNVMKRLKMKRDTFSIKYQDDEGDWVLIACDEDLQKCMEISRSLRKTTIKMLVDLPISHYAP